MSVFAVRTFNRFTVLTNVRDIICYIEDEKIELRVFVPDDDCPYVFKIDESIISIITDVYIAHMWLGEFLYDNSSILDILGISYQNALHGKNGEYCSFDFEKR